MNLKKFFLLTFGSSVTMFALIIVNYHWMSYTSKDRIFTNIAQLPKYDTIMVLGSGRIYNTDRPNYLFIGRMKATSRLALNQHGKHIIASGADDVKKYDEPHDMKKELIRRGVNEDMISEDDKGSNTFNSVMSLSVNKSNKVIIISQHYHLERALYFARSLNVDAVGYAAGGFPGATPFVFIAREYLARIKARFLVLFNKF